MLKNVYLIAAVIGAIVPYLFFFQFFHVEGVNLSVFLGALFVNDAAAGFTADLLITSFIFWFYMFVEYKKLNAPKPHVFIFLNLTIGLSCALPAYLYAKSKQDNS